MGHQRLERSCSCGETLYFHRDRPIPGDPLAMRGVEVFHGRGESMLHIPLAEELAILAVNPLGERAVLARIRHWIDTVHRYEEVGEVGH